MSAEGGVKFPVGSSPCIFLRNSPNFSICYFRNIRATRRSNKKQTKDGEEPEKEASEDLLPKKLGDDMDIMDNTECKFNVNSFKMVYVVNSESYLYKRMALKRAREVWTYFLVLQGNNI